MNKVICPYCGAEAKLMPASTVYPSWEGEDKVWVCYNYPDCDAYVGAHKSNDRPKGTLAKKELRDSRKILHGAFDPIWIREFMLRKEAYAWLAGEMGLSKEDTHIGLFDVEQCEKALDIVMRYRGFKK